MQAWNASPRNELTLFDNLLPITPHTNRTQTLLFSCRRNINFCLIRTLNRQKLHHTYATLWNGVSWDIPRITCIFSEHRHMSAYTKKIQATSVIFYDIPRQSIV